AARGEPALDETERRERAEAAAAEVDRHAGRREAEDAHRLGRDGPGAEVVTRHPGRDDQPELVPRDARLIEAVREGPRSKWRRMVVVTADVDVLPTVVGGAVTARLGGELTHRARLGEVQADPVDREPGH